ncbi:MAG: bacterioferritin-associated ferredoxin [Flavobacteriales bacterium]|jgi:bacterioferritin-associated ferredoxin
MYVCLCKEITDRDIRDAVESGASSFKEVRTSLGVSSVCGSCSSLAKDVYNAAKQEQKINSHLFYQLA